MMVLIGVRLLVTITQGCPNRTPESTPSSSLDNDFFCQPEAASLKFGIKCSTETGQNLTFYLLEFLCFKSLEFSCLI